VHFYNLYPGVRRIEPLAGLGVQILSAAPSGMALLYDPARHPELGDVVAAFAPSAPLRAPVKSEARHYRYYHRVKRKLRRNRPLIKGVNVVCRMLGARARSLIPEP
jgi:hypothetical protein